MRTPGDKAYGIIDPAAFLGPAVRALNALDPRPDCVLITGDLTDLGRPHEYQVLRDHLQALEIPYFLLPGNHDDRAELRVAFPDHAYLQGKSPFIQYAVETYPLRLLALDTVVPMKSHGELCQDRLDWLAARLAEQPDRPTLVLMHHPPFLPGIEHMDAIGLLSGAPELERIVSRFPHVERVLCGHLHRTIFQRFGGTSASTCPGTAHQLALELGPRPTLQYIMEPPGYQLHWWQGKNLVTPHAVIGDYPGPYPCA
ncbi:hypothetical protein G6F31_014370 [Rhizopus arrhizus]|nr:hypothetical protein G6F31_014370 [Rhizopus arrhizus]